MHGSRGKVLIERELTHSVIQAFYYVYNRLDYGFLEAIYVEGLCRVLKKKGHLVERPRPEFYRIVDTRNPRRAQADPP
jgi:hypothetical protein